MKQVALSTWISWITGLIVTAVTLTAFAFSTFRTERKAREFETRVERKLEKIDIKIDLIKDKLYRK